MRPPWLLGISEPHSVGRLRYGYAPAILIIILCLSGCGSTGRLVKQNLNPQPLLSNALSRAVCFASNSEKCKSADPAEVPLDESSPRVKAFIKEYAYGRRETMKRYLAQAEQFLPMVKNTCAQEKAPKDLAYLFLLESGANPEARSPANALGMWQFMPATARNYGLRVDSWVDERLDPRKSTQAAISYLKDLHDMFGCWRLALSAYNSGENKLNNVMCKEDSDEYDGICSSKHLKKETKEFVPRFQAIAHIAKHTEKYGFAPLKNATDRTDHDTVAIEGSYPLESLAQAIHAPLDDLVELNPSLIRGATPPSPAHALRVPKGKKSVLLAKLHNIKPDRGKTNIIVHVTHRGDTLNKLVKRYGLKKTKLAGLNPDVNFSKKLKPGIKINIPARAVQTKVKAHKKPKRLSLLRISSDERRRY